MSEVISDEERERLILEHLPHVRMIARRVHEELPENIGLEDLVATGVVGLISAIDNFDPSKNVKLTTQADDKVLAAILNGLAPRLKRHEAKQLEAALASTEQKLQAPSVEEEIVAEPEISLDENARGKAVTFSAAMNMTQSAMKVLLAEDNPVFTSMLGALLRKWGYDPVPARDGNEAWERLKVHPEIRLMLLDWMMPGMDGIELCKQIRAGLDAGGYRYIIMLTARTESRDLVEGFEAGADDYITKPFNAHELLARLRAGQRILEKMGEQQGVLRPILFYSCFISHSSADAEIAGRINEDLRRHHVTCWYAPEDLKVGDKFRQKIDESIRLHDKLLLILSKSSIGSRWVTSEVEAALEEEDRRVRAAPAELRGNTTVLFPIRVDATVFKARGGWVADLRRTRHIGDFLNWRDPDAYNAAFARLLRDLAASDELDSRAREKRRHLKAPTGLKQ